MMLRLFGQLHHKLFNKADKKTLFILKQSKFGSIIFSFSVIFFLIFISLFTEIFNSKIFINSSFIFDFASSLSLITIKKSIINYLT